MSNFLGSLAIIISFLALSVAAQEPPNNYGNVVYAHATLGSIAWVILFPLGAILIRVLSGRNTVWIHAGVQLFALALVVISAGTGIWMTMYAGNSVSDYHPVIGLVLFSFVFLQPISGLLHHGSMRKHGRRTIMSYIHIWFGRVLITLGMINGGLGLLYSGDDTRGESIAYGVVAAFVWIVYVVISITYEVKPRAAITKPAMKENMEVFEEDKKI